MTDYLNQISKLLFPDTGPKSQTSPLKKLIQTLKLPAPRKPTSSKIKNKISCQAHGNWGSLSRLVAAILADQLTRPILFVTAHIPAADEAFDDLQTFTNLSKNQFSTELFPAAEVHLDQPDPSSDVACERLRLLQKIISMENFNQFQLVTSIAALMQPVPNLDFLQQHTLILAVQKDLTVSSNQNDAAHLTAPEKIAAWLTDQNFNRVEQVDTVGDFACRGGIVDIFPPGQNQPARLEFFGDQIESIRFFDLDTQRSTQSVNHLEINSCQSTTGPTEHTNLLNYFPDNTLIILEESTEITQIGKIFHDRLNNPSNLLTVESVLTQFQNFDIFQINRFPCDSCDHNFDLTGQSIQRFEKKSQQALTEITQLAKDHQVFFFCENLPQKQRVEEILHSTLDSTIKKNTKKKPALPPQLKLPIGFLHHGFSLPRHKLIFLSHHEIFAQHQPRRTIRRGKNLQAIESFADLELNDYVVHLNHGIGKFRGLKTLTKNEQREEYLTLEYADKAILHVPAGKIFLVHKYVGCRSGKVKLARLGSKKWKNQKQKITQAIEDLAAELIEIQAYRQAVPGIAFPKDTPWQRELEDAFAYPDTDDQISANHDIKNDLHQNNPMDRLLCGDVGYGKTELAIRAAFKVAQNSKQVAVLVPTTVLAQQHYRTFTERLADFPINIDSLSRFKTSSQARQTLARLTDGQIDILIGTHRILSDDINFTDLGLLIIDEEQRFGVEHKEKLKKVRKTVDVLTMTATPIPRTLHLALLGLRDISSLSTPPLDRRSIVTEVCPFDKQRIAQAISSELARDGQVYFVHNRVHNIQSVADSLQQLVPDARIIIAHGQMPKHQLENRMLQFVNHQADILVCTTIIESGLDIPNVNTIFINDADRFGLAELHQLRGRVGRYKNRAFAYMLLPTRRTINPTAVKRLKAIEEYSQLGSGFRIALRDLEIRGAGNILGPEQSGHIDIIGYELYCHLLANAVRKLKGQSEITSPLTHLELNLDCHLPRSYIPSQKQRMDVYRRLSSCSDITQLEQLHNDLLDLFGKPPAAVQQLIHLAEIRILASRWKIHSIIQQKPDLIFHIPDLPSTNALFANTSGRVSTPDKNTIYLRLPENYFDSPSTILAFLRKLLGLKSPEQKDL